MRNSLFATFLSLSLALPTAAQSCADLTVTGDGTSGTTLTFDLTGAQANAPAFLLLGATAGEFSIDLGPLGSIDLGLMPPFIPVPIGRSDDAGAASVAFDLPDRSMTQRTLNAQGMTLALSIRPLALDVCTSDVEAFSIGDPE